MLTISCTTVKNLSLNSLILSYITPVQPHIYIMQSSIDFTESPHVICKIRRMKKSTTTEMKFFFSKLFFDGKLSKRTVHTGAGHRMPEFFLKNPFSIAGQSVIREARYWYRAGCMAALQRYSVRWNMVSKSGDRLWIICFNSVD